MGFIKTTVLGGVLFLVPVVIFFVFIGKALELTRKLAEPLAAMLKVDSIGGLAMVHLLSVAILVLICFIAGLAAKTASAGKMIESLEDKILSKIPVYELIKTKTQSLLSPEDAERMRVVMVRFDDSWQMAFELEALADGKVSVFLPGAPDPWSGSVCVVTADRIAPLDLSVKSAANLMKRLGKGCGESLHALPGADGSTT